MPTQRDIRRLAMQILYQMDMTANSNAERLEDLLDDTHDGPAVRKEAMGLAAAVWGDHEAADVAATSLAPKWPTHRQPPVDRAILRLAYHEIKSGRTPIKVAINEAVELAKGYCSKESPPFINGVLDKMARQIQSPQLDSPEPSPD